MAFHPKKEQPEFANLKSMLAQAKGKRDDALYKTVQYLIERLTKFQALINGDVVEVNNSVNTAQGEITNLADKKRTYVTGSDESYHLPNSLQLIAGTGITIDTSQAHKIIINGVAGSFVPMSTGAEPLEIMSDGAGHVFLVGYNE